MSSASVETMNNKVKDQLEDRLKDKLQKLEAKVVDFYPPTDPGHDWLHIQRVKRSCITLAVEEGANVEVLTAAALLHDVVNIPKDHPDRKQASRLAAEKSVGLMEELGFESAFINHVSSAIKEHSYSAGLKPSTLEASILQDADRLDALGAIGIMRTVSCGAHMKSSYYHPTEPIPEGRELDDYKYTVDHFFNKLFKLPETMNTEGAKKIAIKRREYMQGFLGQLKDEI